MRALRVLTESGPQAVELLDVPEPEGELIVEVHAGALAFPDVLMTRGQYQVRQALPFTLGWEAAGEVIRAPEGGRFAVGDRVITMTFGSHAEQVAAVPEMTWPLPQGLTFVEGAALPLNGMTALAALERRGRLVAGERMLIHGAAGGVGTAAIQVGKALGATVIASVSTDEKAEVARVAGADQVVVGHDFRSQLDGPVDLIIDPVGGTEHFKESLRALKPEGRLVVVGFASGEIPEIRVNRLLLRNVDVCGCTFVALADTETGFAGVMARLSELVGTGAVRPLIGATYPMEQAVQGLIDLDERRSTGKVVWTR